MFYGLNLNLSKRFSSKEDWVGDEALPIMENSVRIRSGDLILVSCIFHIDHFQTPTLIHKYSGISPSFLSLLCTKNSMISLHLFESQQSIIFSLKCFIQIVPIYFVCWSNYSSRFVSSLSLCFIFQKYKPDTLLQMELYIYFYI